MNAQVDHRIVWDGLFSIAIPGSFVVEEHDGVIGIFDDSNGEGAVHISLATRTKPTSPSRDEAMSLALDFASQRGWSVRTANVDVTKSGGNFGSRLTHRDADGTTWRVWHITSASRVAMITYVIEGELGEEAEIVADVVRSFRWETIS